MAKPSSSRYTRAATLIEYRHICCLATEIYQWYVLLEQLLLLFYYYHEYQIVCGLIEIVAHSPSVADT